MTNSPAKPAAPKTLHARTIRARPTARPPSDVPLPAAPKTAELRELLDANLVALRALHEEHQRMLQTSLKAIDGICTELRTELRTIANVRAPWVRAMSETRALLFIALRELVVGAHEAELSAHTPPPEFTAPPPAERELAAELSDNPDDDAAAADGNDWGDL